MSRRIRIACLGGGTGQAQLLRGLAAHDVDLNAIVGVTDNGGHSGLLRKLFDVPQMGDLRNCLGALAPDGNLLTGLLRTRFTEGDLDGVSLGNLILCALIKEQGTLSKAVEAISTELKLPHRVLPVSDGSAQIAAKLADGRVISGEWDIIKRRPRTPIKSVFHQPGLAALPEALEAIRKADLVVISPGSMLTAIASVLIVRGVADAVRKSRGKTVVVCNIMSQPGQTDGMDAAAHVEIVRERLNARPDVAIVNTGRPPDELRQIYWSHGSTPVPSGGGKVPAKKVIEADLVERPDAATLAGYARAGKHLLGGLHFIRHDAARLAKLIVSLA